MQQRHFRKLEYIIVLIHLWILFLISPLKATVFPAGLRLGN